MSNAAQDPANHIASRIRSTIRHDPDRALQMALGARTNPPSSVIIEMELAECYIALKKPGLAHIVYTNALEQWPENSELRVRAAKFEMERGNPPPAETDPHIVTTVAYEIALGKMQKLLREGKADEAFRTGEGYLKEHNANRNIYILMANACRSKDDSDALKGLLAQAVAAFPTDIEFRRQLAIENIYTGEIEQGLSELVSIARDNSGSQKSTLKILKSMAVHGLGTTSYNALIKELIADGLIPQTETDKWVVQGRSEIEPEFIDMNHIQAITSHHRHDFLLKGHSSGLMRP